MNAKLVFIFFLLAGLLTACNLVSPNITPPSTLPTLQPTPLDFPTSIPSTCVPAPVECPPCPSPTTKNHIVLNRAAEVIESVSEQDMIGLSAFVHPVNGLRFSPYSYVYDTDLVFTAQQVAALPADSKVYSWGDAAGSGAPIDMGFPDYYADFIYDVDFANAPEMSLNHRLGNGSTIDNAFEFYPGGMIVEYYFPGIDPQYEGMDWRSLRLVFTELNSTWYLVGLIHDEWTP